jgi:hypothetical protein
MSGPLGATPWMYDDSAFYPLTIDQSLKFNDDETQYLSWTPDAAGNRKTWTWSGWVKRGNLSIQRIFTAGTSGSSYFQFRFDTNHEILLSSEQPSTVLYLKTTQKFRDTSAWYHLVVVMDTTQSTAADRTKLYVNGSLVTDFSSTTRPSQNTDLLINSSTTHMIGALSYGATSGPYDGYLSDIHFIDGQALAPTNFGEFKESIWIPKVYNGTYGTNGFHLPFKNDDTVEGFNTVTYRGNGGTQSISGLGLSPNLVWIKERSSTSGHVLTDTIRGVNKHLVTSSTGAETTVTNGLTSFDADGFSVGGNGAYSQSGQTYVAWAWDAGSGSAVSNTDGTITSTVKANPAYGFSIVKWNGTSSNGSTIGHGLGVSPNIIITKSLSNASSWVVGIGNISGFNVNDYLTLQTTGAKATSTTFYQAYNSDTFTVGVSSANEMNKTNNGYVSYCFAEVAGYSSIGSYSGTGSSGNVVTGLGFKPAWLMIKRTNSGTNGWMIYDSTRDTVNDRTLRLKANASDAEDTGDAVSFDIDGFTLNATGASTNGSTNTYIYMAFADTRDAAFWRDTSGNNNDWTPNNLDYRDSLLDSTTNNFAVMNPLDKDASWILSEGNLKVSLAGTAGDTENIAATMAVPNSKLIYFEAKPNNSLYGAVGIAKLGFAELNPFSGSGSSLLYLGGGGTAKIYVDGSIVYDTGATWSLDIIGVAVDMSNSKVWFSKNGSWLGSGTQDPETNTGGFSISPDEVMPYGFKGNSNVTQSFTFNFGQDSTFSGAKPMGAFTDDSELGNFQYEPPANYLSLCTANFPEPEILDGSEYFDTVLYTGNGGTQNITGVGFQPDWVWIKSRDEGTSSYTGHNVVQDSVRGVGTDTALVTNESYSEAGTGYSNAVTAFDSDGFSLGSRNQVNYNADAFVAWNWKAGGTAVSNTDGSITSQVSANTAAGFSVVSYTGTGANATVGHSLGVQPSMIIVKVRSTTNNWAVYHSSLGNTKALLLDTTDAGLTSSLFWNNTTPTSSVFSISTGNSVNNSGQTYIAYCFANIENYSKVGSYTGNGSTDGTFVYTGFRPAWVMIKRTDSANSWFVFDNQRDSHNFNIRYLNPNSSSAEAVGTTGYNDFLSNGFKIRTSGTFSNANGGTYIYLAFAENPFKYSNAR